MITERRKKLFRCAQKLQHVANGKATPEAAEFFFRNFLRLDRVVRGLHPFQNNKPTTENNNANNNQNKTQLHSQKIS